MILKPCLIVVDRAFCFWTRRYYKHLICNWFFLKGGDSRRGRNGGDRCLRRRNSPDPWGVLERGQGHSRGEREKDTGIRVVHLKVKVRPIKK